CLLSARLGSSTPFPYTTLFRSMETHMKHFFLTLSLRVRLALCVLGLFLPTLLAVTFVLALAGPLPDALRGGLIGLALAAALLAWLVYQVLLRMVLNPLLDSGQLLRRIEIGRASCRERGEMSVC